MKCEKAGKACSTWTLLCQLQYNVLLFGGEVCVLLKEQATSKAMKMETLVVSRIMVPIYYATWHHMSHYNAESLPWEPQIYLPNFMQDIWGSLWDMRYNMWGSDSAVHWREFKSSEMWHRVTEYALPAFCWTMVPSLWGLDSPGRKLNPEDRGPTIAENVSNYTHNDTASHVTLHSCRP